MLKIFKAYRKKQAIRSYMRMRPRLVKRYGHRRYYRPKQVLSIILAGLLPTDYDCYAYAIYCSPEAFQKHHEETGEDCNYSEMRAEVAQLYDYSGADTESIDFNNSAFAEAGGGDWSADGAGGGSGGDGDGGE